MIVLDRLHLAAGLVLLVVLDRDAPEPRPLPWVVDEGRRARPGDGAAEALTTLLAGGTRSVGRFRITAWRASPVAGERIVGVDQTNQSVVVGEQAVVKWMRTAETGPHPAPPILNSLLRHGFTGMPQPWGLVEWRAHDDVAPRLLVAIDSLVADAEDGWTWAINDLRESVTSGSTSVVDVSGRRLGTLVAELHTALSDTGRPATDADVAAWRSGAYVDLDRALELTIGPAHELLAARADAVRRMVVPPSGMTGTPLLLVHGDLHIGQVLRSGDTYLVTDFDGSPVVAPAERTTPQPAALDVAGMAQSISHAAYVLRRHEPDHPIDIVRRGSAAFVAAFLSSYADRLAALGTSGLFKRALVPGFRLRQVCREFVYAAAHLPRWSYVPEAALVDLVPVAFREETP